MITPKDMEKILSSEKVIEIDNKIKVLDEKVYKYVMKIVKIEGKIDKIKESIEKSDDKEEKLHLNLEIRFCKEDIRDVENKIKENKDKIERFNVKRNSVIENIQKEMELDSIKITVITEFLYTWARNYKAFLDKNKKDYISMYNEYLRETGEIKDPTYNKEDNKKYNEINSKFNRKVERNIDPFVVDNYKLEGNEWDNKVNRYVEKESKFKEKMFYKRIGDLAGDIISADLEIGYNDEINGTVTGTKNKVRVTTITAGGYNIQRFHFRVLVHIIK